MTFAPPSLRVFGLVSVLCIGAAAPSFAQEDTATEDGPLIGEVEGASFKLFPLAVPDIRVADKRSDERRPAVGITSVLRRDLALTGVFEVLKPQSYLDTDGLAKGDVKFDDWLNIGADGVLKAQLTGTPDKFTVQVYAYQVASTDQVLSQSYAGTKDTIRDVAHRIADDVVKAFTGLPGVARTHIVAVKKVAGSKHVFIMDADGERQRQLTRAGTLNLLPSWAPDGRSVLFTSYRYDNPDLFEISIAGGPARRVSSRPGLNTGGRISPDGQTIALTLSKDGNSEIYLLDRQGGLKKRLTSSWGIDTSPYFSPDGSNIVFVSSRAGNPHLYRMPAAGGKAERLTFQGKYNQTPAYSPKGNKIAFTARDEFNRFDLFIYHVEDGKITRVTQDQGNNEDPSFAPNGNLITFISDRTGSRQVWIGTLDGRFQERITTTGRYSSPNWGPFEK